MRCPKCGYISFDNLRSCAKCAASLERISDSITGTVVRAQEPFFLATALGHAVQPGLGGEEVVEFDLAEADELSESGEEIDLSGEEEGIPMVDLSPFASSAGVEVEDEAGISFSLPEEEEEEVTEMAAGAEEEVAAGEHGTIDFMPGEELAEEPETLPGEEGYALDLPLEESREAEAEGIAFALPQEEEEVSWAGGEEEEALPELDFDTGEGEEALALDAGLMPGGGEEPAEEEEEAEAGGAGLKLDIDVDLENEPAEEEMVFNLEDIDMSDLVIEEQGGAQDATDRPEETALDLEDFLSEGKKDEGGIPMNLSMDDIDLGDDEQDKENDELPIIKH